jgi:hypothetical protein
MAAPTIYNWAINFSDLTDESIIKLGETYLSTKPSVFSNYWNLTSQKFISYCGVKGIDVNTLNILDRKGSLPPHYLVIQWQINCLQMLVCQNNIGLNDISGYTDDKYLIKYKFYRDELKAISGSLSFETILNGTMQQNYVRGRSSFNIIPG